MKTVCVSVCEADASSASTAVAKNFAAAWAFRPVHETETASNPHCCKLSWWAALRILRVSKRSLRLLTTARVFCGVAGAVSWQGSNNARIKIFEHSFNCLKFEVSMTRDVRRTDQHTVIAFYGQIGTLCHKEHEGMLWYKRTCNRQEVFKSC